MSDETLKVIPYRPSDLITIAVKGTPLDERRVIATYADPKNWIRVHADGRCWWSWVGPVIVGYELAEMVDRSAAT